MYEAVMGLAILVLMSLMFSLAVKNLSDKWSNENENDKTK
jgi:hypothetical protein